MPHTPSYRRILHKMGYYDYQRGLIYRHLNQDNGWIDHEEKCRNFILKALDYYNPQKVTVLGSGWLLELPLAEIAGRVNSVILSDIVHPPEVIRQTSDLKNVILSEDDITGGLIEEVWNKAGNRTFLSKLKTLDGILIPDYQPVEDPGMVISLNILTQLEVLPEKLLKRKSKATDDEFLAFRKRVQINHIKYLQNHKSVLISDVAEIFTETGGNSIEKKTALVELPSGKLKQEWTWDFDLKKMDYNRKSSVLKVVGIII